MPTFACLSGAGRSAIAVWRLVGVDAATAAQLAALGLRTTDNRVALRGFGDDIREEVVVSAIDSATLELTTHGGGAAGERARALLANCGLREKPHAECRDDDEFECLLANAATRAVADALLTAFVTFDERLANWRPTAEGRRTALTIRHRLRAPVRVVLRGRPNVGKSSLLNALLGYERAVVYDREGVTRDRISARAIFGGWPLELLDTAGVERHSFTSPSPSETSDTAQPSRNEIEVLVVDGTRSPPDATRFAATIATKQDLLSDRQRTEIVDTLARHPSEAFLVSSVTGSGLARVIDWLTRIARVELGTGPVPVTLRQMKQLEERAAG